MNKISFNTSSASGVATPWPAGDILMPMGLLSSHPITLEGNHSTETLVANLVGQTHALGRLVLPMQLFRDNNLR